MARQIPQACKVLSSDSRAGLDLDRYDTAIGCLDDGVDLELVLRPVMIEAGAFLSPGQLPCQLRPARSASSLNMSPWRSMLLTSRTSRSMSADR